MAQMTGEFPRVIPRPVWLTARARNAVHRPMFIAAVGIGAFIAALVALILAPQQIRRAAPLAALPVDARPDTMPFIAALAHVRVRLAAAELSLATARAHASVPPAPVVDTINPAITARRDSVAAAINDLDALLTRVETAPLAATYRALGESAQLSSNPRSKSLLDSLAEIEREREALGPADAADPALVALTARTAEIGRSIQGVAQDRREVLRQQFAKMSAPTSRQAVALAPAADTVAWIAERDSAESVVGQATTALSDARTATREYDRAVTRAREDARLDAPPVALLAAALIFGVALGFGSAFAGEMRHPRVSDEHELERMTGSRVLATVRPRPRNPDRRRRSADRNAPPYFDPGADGYQLTYLHVARAGASRVTLTLTGEDPGIAAVVAVNVAAIAADEARSTIVIDTDARASSVAAALRTHAEPGVTDILERHVEWAEVTSQVLVGRDRTIDVVPSGLSTVEHEPSEVTELFRRDAARLARHYEAIVIVAPLEHAKAGLPAVLPIPDTILCARVGHTRIAHVQSALDAIRAAGGTPVGVVLWDAARPGLASPERIARARRPLDTPVMQAITPSAE
jgi:Mrp family chromosome partitioning ATPase